MSTQLNQSSSYLGLGITHSTVSLSQKLKQANEKAQKQLSRSTTLPTLNANHLGSANTNNRNLSQEVYSMYLSPSKAKIVATRLSGLPESVNSSALFTEKVAMPTKPVTICIRCSSTHAALCMLCVEQDCQNALTFYRKTRAAGAATLFSKAFIEAGYTKLLKFVIFRLLKNGFETRRRQHMKKKTVVEKLFGTNLVCIPFGAWKRYTKENIMNRKNRTIAELSERVKILESQVHKLTSTVQENNFQIDFLKGEVAKRDAVINDQKNEIGALKHLLKSDRNRVKFLVQMVSPIIRYSAAVNKIIHQKLGETGRYISHATLPTTYNYSNVFQDTVFDEFMNNKLTQESKSSVGKSVSKSAPLSKTSVVASDIALQWISMISQCVDDQLPPPGGRKLSHYLPAHQIAESLFDLRSGKQLARAIVSLVLDRQSIARQQDVGHSLPSFTVKYSKSWPLKGIELEDLEHMKTLQNKTMELISFSLELATYALDLPHHSPNDVFSGKVDVIFQVVVELMNAAMPRVNQKDRNAIEQRINRFYELNSELEELQSDKPDLTALNVLDSFLQREFYKRPELSEEETLAAQLKSNSDDPFGGESMLVGGGEIDYRLVASMNDKQYEKMCSIVDETISSCQFQKVTDLAGKVISINEKLLDLQSIISQGRDQRDMEIRLTTEIRQLLFAQYMNHNFVGSPPSIQFHATSLNVNTHGTAIHKMQLEKPPDSDRNHENH